MEAARAYFEAQDLYSPAVGRDILLERLVSCLLVLVPQTHIQVIWAGELKQKNTMQLLIEYDDVWAAPCCTKLGREHVVFTR